MRARALSAFRPTQVWDGRHDPVLEQFGTWVGQADGVHSYDFLGIRTDPKFRPAVIRHDPAGMLCTSYPTPTQTYLELVFVLRAVLASNRPSVTCIEVGAGFGHWLVTVARAAELRGKEARLVGLEMEPQRYHWMLEHFRNNGLDPSAHQLLNSAVGAVDGKVVFAADASSPWDYGLRIERRADRWARLVGGSPAKAQEVDCRRLGPIIASLDVVDLLHMDIQGEERFVVPEARQAMRSAVARAAIATHSSRTHAAIRQLLRQDGWHLAMDYPPHGFRRTPVGGVYFLDGLLAAVNPDHVEA